MIEDIVVFFDMIAFVAFGSAMICGLGIGREKLAGTSRFFLLLFLGTYFFVSFSNVLEHAAITGIFDRYEDFVEPLAVPFFLLFVYSVQARQKGKKGS